MATTRNKQVDTRDSDMPEPTYEQARDELIGIVNRLESGGEPLTESMALFQRGEYLATLCEQYLTQARATIEAVRQDSGGAT